MLPYVLAFQNSRESEPLEPSSLFQDDAQISVFESMRTYHRVIFRLDEHLARLTESAASVRLPIHFSLRTARDRLRCLAKEADAPSAFMRITVTRDLCWMGVMPLRLPAKSEYERGVSLLTVSIRKVQEPSTLPQVKTSDYLGAVLSLVEGQRRSSSNEHLETLHLDAVGFVQECRTSNMFIVKGRTLLTPPTQGILNGVTRRTVIELCAENHLPCQEVLFTRHQLYNADEAFLTYTSGEIVPVRKVDGRAIGKRCPGELTRALRRKYLRFVQEYVRTHRS